VTGPCYLVGMASIEKRQRSGQTRWYARYRDPTGRQRVRVFDRRIDAERYLTTVESAKLVGSYVDPALAWLTVGEWTGPGGSPGRPT
jgi:hypothetical protein